MSIKARKNLKITDFWGVRINLFVSEIECATFTQGASNLFNLAEGTTILPRFQIRKNCFYVWTCCLPNDDSLLFLCPALQSWLKWRSEMNDHCTYQCKGRIRNATIHPWHGGAKREAMLLLSFSRTWRSH